MRALFYTSILFLIVLSMSACRSRAYHASTSTLSIAQEAPIAKEGEITKTYAPEPSVRVSAQPTKASLKPLAQAKQIAKQKAEKIRELKKKTERQVMSNLTAAKQIKKSQEFRAVDLLFFVVVAVLLCLALILLKEIAGFSTDVIIFIGMGLLVVFVLVYIYLHTWVFTA